MSKMSEIFKNEELLEKVAKAETKEDAKKVCKEGGLEVSDADLDEIAGGLTTAQKVLIGLGTAAGAGVLATGAYFFGKGQGWWGGSESPVDPAVDGPAHEISPRDLQAQREFIKNNPHGGLEKAVGQQIRKGAGIRAEGQSIINDAYNRWGNRERRK